MGDLSEDLKVRDKPAITNEWMARFSPASWREIQFNYWD